VVRTNRIPDEDLIWYRRPSSSISCAGPRIDCCASGWLTRSRRVSRIKERERDWDLQFWWRVMEEDGVRPLRKRVDRSFGRRQDE